MPKQCMPFEKNSKDKYSKTHCEDFSSGEVFYVKKCEHCHKIITARLDDTYTTINPKRQRMEYMKCPCCTNPIKIRDIA